MFKRMINKDNIKVGKLSAIYYFEDGEVRSIVLGLLHAGIKGFIAPTPTPPQGGVLNFFVYFFAKASIFSVCALAALFDEQLLKVRLGGSIEKINGESFFRALRPSISFAPVGKTATSMLFRVHFPSSWIPEMV